MKFKSRRIRIAEIEKLAREERAQLKKKKLAPIHEKMEALAEKMYYMIVTPAVERKMMELPKGWFVTKQTFEVQVVRVNEGKKEYLTQVGSWSRYADSSITMEMGKSKLQPFSMMGQSGCLTLPASCQEAKELIGLIRQRLEVINDSQDLYRKVYALLKNTLNTTGKLKEEWPELYGRLPSLDTEFHHMTVDVKSELADIARMKL